MIPPPCTQVLLFVPGAAVQASTSTSTRECFIVMLLLLHYHYYDYYYSSINSMVSVITLATDWAADGCRSPSWSDEKNMHRETRVEKNEIETLTE